MARYDKYDGVAGGFRGTAAEDALEANFGVPLGASTDANGLTHVGGAAQQSGYVGVTIVDRTKRKAGDRLDIMTHGEIVYDSDDTADALVAGTTYYLDAAGALTTAAPAAGANGFKVGHTEEAWRLVVRFESIQGA